MIHCLWWRFNSYLDRYRYSLCLQKVENCENILLMSATQSQYMITEKLYRLSGSLFKREKQLKLSWSGLLFRPPWVNLRFYPFVSDVWGRRESPRFPCVTPGVWELPLSLFPSEVAKFSACGFLQLIKPTVVDFCFAGGSCYSGWWVWKCQAKLRIQGMQ